MAPKKVALIVGSTRPVRIGPSVTEWVHKIIKTSSATLFPDLTTLEVASFNLPIFNESVHPSIVPAMAQFEHEHSKNWSAAIQPFDGYILVSAEYNVGIPGAVKNAIDYLYNEWAGKPMLIITYGTQGGKTASENLKTSISGMKVNVMETRPQLPFAGPGQEEMILGAQGKLGEKTIELWDKMQKESVLKGFGELVTALEAPPPVVEKPKGSQPEPEDK